MNTNQIKIHTATPFPHQSNSPSSKQTNYPPSWEKSSIYSLPICQSCNSRPHCRFEPRCYWEIHREKKTDIRSRDSFYNHHADIPSVDKKRMSNKDRGSLSFIIYQGEWMPFTPNTLQRIPNFDKSSFLNGSYTQIPLSLSPIPIHSPRLRTSFFSHHRVAYSRGTSYWKFECSSSSCKIQLTIYILISKII